MAYQATKYEVFEARKLGRLFGAIVGGVLNFGVPNFLNSHFNLTIASDWEPACIHRSLLQYQRLLAPGF